VQLVDNLVEHILKYEEALAGTHILLALYLGNLIQFINLLSLTYENIFLCFIFFLIKSLLFYY